MAEFKDAIPQITKNYREFVEHIINIGGEFIKLNKRYKFIIFFLCCNVFLTIVSIILTIIVIYTKG